LFGKVVSAWRGPPSNGVDLATSFSSLLVEDFEGIDEFFCCFLFAANAQYLIKKLSDFEIPGDDELDVTDAILANQLARLFSPKRNRMIAKSQR